MFISLKSTTLFLTIVEKNMEDLKVFRLKNVIFKTGFLIETGWQIDKPISDS